jgi:membrane protease YdiL (CAAX protease family)
MDPLAKNANPGIANAKFNYKPASCKSILHIRKKNGMKTPDQITVFAVCYVLLFLLCFWVWKMKGDTLISAKVQCGRWIFLHIRHTLGFIIMVLLPLLLLPVLPEGIIALPKEINSLQLITLMVTGLLLRTVAAKEASHLETKNPVQTGNSSVNAVLHIIFRSAFLTGYEWFFRGCILMSCVSLFGIVPAIIINLVLYSLIHSFNGKKEMLGSIPMGVLLCVFTHWWNSVWPAVFLHLLLSFSYELKILHPFLVHPKKIII